MSSRCLSLLLVAACACGQNVLRVCADPNNLPFSDRQGEGFENKIAERIAAHRNARLEYVWWTERKSFASKSLNSDACDVVMGVPAALPDVLTTQPYYRSTYVFVSRQDRHLQLSSLLDARLADLRIGMHVTGDDYAPPAFLLARRGITNNIVAFSLLGAYGEPNPARKLVDAVDQGAVDVAIVWGPLAGFFAQHSETPLEIQPVTPDSFMGVPFVYSISAAVRKGNTAMKAGLDETLAAEDAAIQQILNQYAVPQVH